MKQGALVLGCGKVGSAIARDLADDSRFSVTVADAADAPLLRVREKIPHVETLRADLSDPVRLHSLVLSHDVVFGAMPSALGFSTLQTVLEAGKPYVDISFMPEDGRQLDELARSRGVTAVIDCGVAPGLSNLLVGYEAARLKRVDRVVIYVGGLPRERRLPFEYKAPFAPGDVLEEYIRPARIVEDGRIVVKAALSEPELIDVPRVGTLEGFLTDGLRSLVETIPARHMVEKTLRYPGHAALMRAFRDAGFFDKKPVEVNGHNISPIQVTSRLLFHRWALAEGEEEFTVLRVIVEGVDKSGEVRITHDLYDQTDPKTGLTSMARTTAFPCAIVGRMLAEGVSLRAGVFAPEELGKLPDVFAGIRRELSLRGISLTTREERLEPSRCANGAC